MSFSILSEITDFQQQNKMYEYTLYLKFLQALKTFLILVKFFKLKLFLYYE